MDLTQKDRPGKPTINIIVIKSQTIFWCIFLIKAAIEWDLVKIHRLLCVASTQMVELNGYNIDHCMGIPWDIIGRELDNGIYNQK